MWLRAHLIELATVAVARCVRRKAGGIFQSRLLERSARRVSASTSFLAHLIALSAILNSCEARNEPEVMLRIRGRDALRRSVHARREARQDAAGRALDWPLIVGWGSSEIECMPCAGRAQKHQTPQLMYPSRGGTAFACLDETSSSLIGGVHSLLESVRGLRGGIRSGYIKRELKVLKLALVGPPSKRLSSSS